MAKAPVSAERGDVYFATEEAEKMPAIIAERYRKYLAGLDERGLLATYRRAYRLYYGQDAAGGYASSHGVTFGGDQGQEARLRSNQFRSLGRRFLTMATADRPHFEATATNDSSDSMAQTGLVAALLDYSLDEDGGALEQHSTDAAEMTLPYSEAYVYQWWDVDAGEAVSVEDVPELDESGQPVLDESGQPKTTERAIMSGDAVVEAMSPIDVARDLDAPPRSAPQWLIVRRWTKKWDLIAKYPEKRDELMGATPADGVTRGLWEDSMRREGSDWLPMLTLYHLPTQALPGGRMIECVGAVWLTDGALPYGELPLHRVRPATEMEHDTGYSDFWDLMATSDAYDSVISALVSAHDMQAIPNLLAAEGQEVSPRMMTGGGRIVEWKSDGRSPPPSWMQPPNISESNLALRGVILEDLETNSGMNGVARGNPGSSQKTASSQALAQSVAVQFASSFQRSVANLYKSLANARVRLWQRFATEERIAYIAGPGGAPVARSFRADDIKDVRLVRVDIGNPLLRTIAGKREIADTLLDKYGPEEIPATAYLAFLGSGRLQQIYKRRMGQVTLIAAENEKLTNGEEVIGMKTDNHFRHITEHSCIFDNPDVRYNEAIVERAGAHLLWHATEYDRMRNEESALWAMTQEPLPGAMMEMLMSMGAPAPAPGGPPPGEPMPEGEGPEAPRAEVPGAPGGEEMPMLPAAPGGERVGAEGVAA